MIKSTKDEFILKAKDVHGEKYIYKQVIYNGVDEKVKIICPEHGTFEQTPYYHLKGHGCPICRYIKARENNPNLSNTNDFIFKAKEKYGDLYGYEKVEYFNAKTKVCIICKEHGEFYVTPNNHLRGKGCPICGRKRIIEAHKCSKEQWAALAETKHNGKYDYSLAEYKGTKEKVRIVCPIHGEFWQNPINHLSGDGCPKCAKVYRPTGSEWIKRASKIHDDKYDYSKVEYVNNSTKICIICHKKDADGKEHGEFWQTPANHINGQGCPICKESHGENFVRYFLKKENIEFIREKTFPWLLNEKTGKNLYYDFYLTDLNIAIEYQGEPHFKPIKHFGGDKAYKKRIFNDELKKRLSKENNVSILYIDYRESINEIEDKIKNLKKDGKNTCNRS